MSAHQYHTVWSGLMASGADDIETGDAVVLNAAGTGYVVASTLNLAAAGRPAFGIALSAASEENRSFEFQLVGPVAPSITKLVPGTSSAINIDANGRLQRVASPTASSAVVGTCDVDGEALVSFNLPWNLLALLAAGSGSSPAGNVGDIQYKASSTTLGAAPLAVPFEYFGGVGDGVTNNATAFAAFITAATTAAAAGRPIMLQLGCGNYLISSGGPYTIPAGGIRGQGKAVSKITFSQNATFVYALSDNTEFCDFALVGNTGASAIGISFGSGSAPMPDINVSCSRLFFDDWTEASRCWNGLGNHRGVHYSNCDFRIPQNAFTNIGIQCLDQADYVFIHGCKFRGATNGTTRGYAVQTNSANTHLVNCDASEVNCGVRLLTGSSNTGHGSWVGGSINHVASPVIGSGDLGSSGWYFDDVDMYGGELYLANLSGVHFNNCRMSFDVGGSQNILVDAGGVNNRMTGCTFFTTNTPTVDIAATAQLWFRDCLHVDGSAISTIEAHIQRSYTFPSDANQTLSLQETTCKTLIVASGVITASRQITFNQTPAAAQGRQVTIVNNNAQSITVKWTTGSAVTVLPGQTAIVGSDNTNAIFLQHSASSSGTSTTVQTSDGAGGFTAATNVKATTSRITIATVPGSVASAGMIGIDYSAGARVVISSRNSTDSADWDILTVTGSQTTLGIDGGIANIRGDRIDLVPGASGLTLTVNGTSYASIAKAAGDFIAFGSAPASTGAWRLTNNTFGYSKDSGGTNRRVIGLDSTDTVLVGDSIVATNLIGSAVGVYGTTIQFRTSDGTTVRAILDATALKLEGQLWFNDGGGQYYKFATSDIAADRTITLPVLTGNDVLVFEAHTQTLTNKTLTSPTVNSPTIGGSPLISATTLVGSSSVVCVTGRATQAMADANQTPASSVYSRVCIKCTGAMTATRTLTLPHPASEDASYRKLVNNATTGGQLITVTTGTGTSADCANNVTGEFFITPSGVERLWP